MAFQRVIINGVPFWRAASALYAYDLPMPTAETALKLGEEVLYPNWKELYAEKLASYRSTVTSQVRKAVK
jgi:hypothetical protein